MTSPVSKNIELIKKTVIKGLASDPILLELLVLKGGNAIYYGHQLDGRGSKDIDYSMEGELGESKEEIKNLIEKSLTKSFSAIEYILVGYKFKEKPKTKRDDLISFWGGYEVSFKIVHNNNYDPTLDEQAISNKAEIVKDNSSPVFTIDISMFEYCQNDKEKKTLDDTVIYVYPKRLIIAEKLRALCQQTEEYKTIIHSNTNSPRPRDFYDIYHLLEYHSNEIDIESQEFLELLTMVFSAKKVPLNFLKLIDDQYKFHEASAASLSDTIKGEKEEFSFYFNQVKFRVITPLLELIAEVE